MTNPQPSLDESPDTIEELYILSSAISLTEFRGKVRAILAQQREDIRNRLPSKLWDTTLLPVPHLYRQGYNRALEDITKILDGDTK